MNWLQSLFRRKPVYQLVEVEKPRAALQEGTELRESIATLSGHPGFVYLITKLRYQRYLLERKLKESRFPTIQDVELVQSGIFWTNWLEDQVNTAVNRIREKATTAATETETSVFEAIQKTIELVGGK